MKRILLVVTILSFFFSCSIKNTSIFILPENYTGYVLIIYNQDIGSAKVFKKGKRVYNIPSTGVLKTKFEPDYGLSLTPEFHYMTNDKKSTIPFVSNFDEVPENEVVCYGGTIVKVYSDTEEKDFIIFSSFFVGNKNQIEIASERVRSLKYKDILEM